MIQEAAMSAAKDYIEDIAAQGRLHFTPDEVQAALGGSRNAVRLALWRLGREGLVAHLAQGFYVIVPPEYRGIGCRPAVQIVPALMEQLGLDYYVGLLSAAQFHGAAHHKPQVFQVVAEKSRRGITCGAVRISFLKRKRLAEVPVQFLDTPYGKLRVSTVESTAVDLVYYRHRADGLDYVGVLIEDLAEQMDPERLVAVVKTAPLPVAQRLGHLLEMAGAGDKAVLLKRYVQEEARHAAPLIPALPRLESVRDLDWKLDINADVVLEP